jgi:hypothetical protein
MERAWSGDYSVDDRVDVMVVREQVSFQKRKRGSSSHQGGGDAATESCCHLCAALKNQDINIKEPEISDDYETPSHE